MAKPTLNSDILTAALIGFEVQKARIDNQIAEIRSQLDGGRAEPDAASDSGKPKRKVSAKARRRMAKAQKLRWKKVKQADEPATAETAKQKRVMSPSARKAISAAQKARWAVKKTGPAKKAGRKKRAKASAPEQAVAAGA